jgi:hypothetical protein
VGDNSDLLSKKTEASDMNQPKQAAENKPPYQKHRMIKIQKQTPHKRNQSWSEAPQANFGRPTSLCDWAEASQSSQEPPRRLSNGGGKRKKISTGKTEQIPVLFPKALNTKDTISQLTVEIKAGSGRNLCYFDLCGKCHMGDYCPYEHLLIKIDGHICCWNLTRLGCKHKEDPTQCKKTHQAFKRTCLVRAGQKMPESLKGFITQKQTYALVDVDGK